RLRHRQQPRQHERRRQLHLRPSVEVARQHHRRLHRDGARLHGSVAAVARRRPAPCIRAAAGRRIRAPARALVVARHCRRRDGAAGMSATSRILAGLAAGAIAGLLLAWIDPALGIRVADVVQPFGKLWLNALQMTVVPLVLALVIVGVNTAADAAATGRVARRAIIVFLLILAGAAAMAAVLAPARLARRRRGPGLAQALSGAAGSSGAAVAPASWADSLVAMVPSNAIAAAAESAMLPLVVFALFFGFALTRIDPVQRE